MAELPPKASLTEQAVSKHCDYRRRECASRELIIDGRWVCLNHVPEEKGHDGLTSAERMKRMAHTPDYDRLLAITLDLKKQLAHQMAANERMAAEKDQLSVELATLKAEAEKLKAERNLLDGALTTMQETAAESEELLEESEGRVNALKAAGNALLEQIEQGSDWEIFEPEAETLRALCGGLKPAESPR